LYKKRIDIVLVDISQPQKINDAFEHIKKQAKNIEFSKYIAIIVFGFEKEFPSQKDLEGIGCTAIIPKSISKIERRDDLQSLMKMVKK
jgi:hypothetical protein